jgi:hypothetical protein
MMVVLIFDDNNDYDGDDGGDDDGSGGGGDDDDDDDDDDDVNSIFWAEGPLFPVHVGQRGPCFNSALPFAAYTAAAAFLFRVTR